MATIFQKSVKKVFSNPNHVYPEKIICKKDGTVELRKTYFYRFGDSAEQFAERIISDLKQYASNVNVRVKSTRDFFNQYPKDSYFSVIIEEVK